jgi:hypothetical protein
MFETIFVGNKWVRSYRSAAIIGSAHLERLLEKGNHQTVDIEQKGSLSQLRINFDYLRGLACCSN